MWYSMGSFLPPIEQLDWACQVDCSCQSASEAPADEGCWSKNSPLGSDEMEEAADMFHLEGIDKDPVVDYCSSLFILLQGSAEWWQ
jgi:hypothetical protein